ncbi:hypothetical protein [Adhaeribacter aerolatus]|nr:hypothetical protein [Adhaeribacter aerolatus]
MKYYTKIITLLISIISINLGNAQTINETKEYIIDKVKVNPLKSYKTDAVFGDKILPHVVNIYAGEELKKDEQERIFIIEATLLHQGKPILVLLSAFDVKGINSVTVASQKNNNGREFNYLAINIKNDFLNKTITPKEGGQYETQPNNNNGIVEIPVNLTKEGYDSLRKAFLHLCKSYGGSPLKDGLF